MSEQTSLSETILVASVCLCLAQRWDRKYFLVEKVGKIIRKKQERVRVRGTGVEAKEKVLVQGLFRKILKWSILMKRYFNSFWNEIMYSLNIEAIAVVRDTCMYYIFFAKEYKKCLYMHFQQQVSYRQTDLLPEL